MFSNHTAAPFLSAPLPVYPPIFLLYLSDSTNIVPFLLWELICRNIPAAQCDHLVNTPIILSASASPSHPAVEMT